MAQMAKLKVEEVLQAQVSMVEKVKLDFLIESEQNKQAMELEIQAQV